MLGGFVLFQSMLITITQIQLILSRFELNMVIDAQVQYNAIKTYWNLSFSNFVEVPSGFSKSGCQENQHF